MDLARIVFPRLEGHGLAGIIEKRPGTGCQRRGAQGGGHPVRHELPGLEDRPRDRHAAGRRRPYRRKVRVYVPEQNVPGSAITFTIAQDGGGYLKATTPALETQIHQGRVPVMAATLVDSGEAEAQGVQRRLEYDTLSGMYAGYVESGVLPRAARAEGAAPPSRPPSCPRSHHRLDRGRPRSTVPGPSSIDLAIYADEEGSIDSPNVARCRTPEILAPSPA